MKNAKSVEEYLENQQERVEELKKLRSILQSTELEETIKWGMPTYTLDGRNIVGIGSFKRWSCLWFHEGALLVDKDAKLVNAQEGKTRALRQWRFKNINDINGELIMEYLEEAIDNHKKGLTVKFPKKKTTSKTKIKPPGLIQELLESDKAFREAFNGLTYAQRRDYCEYIDEPKRETTKLSRLQKIIPLIKSNKPLAAIWAK